jgi:hypothetical protein
MLKKQDVDVEMTEQVGGGDKEGKNFEIVVNKIGGDCRLYIGWDSSRRGGSYTIL